MQVDAYVQSLQFCGGIPARQITILYAESPGISYDRAIARHPDVRWVKETNFRADLEAAVAGAERYVLLGCDDVLFHGSFDPNPALALLERDDGVFGFSFRMGLNLHSLPSVRDQDGLLRWNWKTAPSGHWSYPWDVSASIYRRDFVLRVLNSFEGMTNPNRFESYLAEVIHNRSFEAPSELASFHESKSVTLTVNRVQDEYPNEFDASGETSPEDLYRAYMSGLQIDWPQFYQHRFNHIHVDGKLLSLKSALTLPVEVIAHDVNGKAQVSARALAARVLMWKMLNRTKEAIRPLLPRSLLIILRRFA